MFYLNKSFFTNLCLVALLIYASLKNVYLIGIIGVNDFQFLKPNESN